MKNTRILLLLKTGLSCFLFVSLCNVDFGQQETAEQFVARVKKAIQNEEWGRARSGIRHALALKPASAEANFIAAQVYWHEGQRSMAIDVLEKAIAVQPIYPEAHFLLARCLVDNGKLGRARDEANIAIAQSTPLFPAYRLLGEIDLEEDKFEEAITSFETALRLAQTGDEKEAAELKQQLRDLGEYVKIFPSFESQKNATDVVRPVPLNSPQPRYTEEARSLKIQGMVSMAVFITANGDVDSVVLFRRLGHGMDEQAMEMARQMKFSPASKSGKAIAYWLKILVEFNLR